MLVENRYFLYTPHIFNAPDAKKARRIFAAMYGTRKTKMSE